MVGAPQVGKTNFVCNYVEKRLAKGRPCLFYPAFGMRSGLMEEIRTDFEMTFHDSSSAHQIVASKLARVAARTKKPILICIDAWNEADLQLAKALDRECALIATEQVQVLITLTTIAAERLLTDGSGNPSNVAVELGIHRSAIPLVQLDPVNASPAVVSIERYTSEETKKAYARYSRVFGVTVPQYHIPTPNPLLLRTAMELYRHQQLPARLDEPDLLRRWIVEKLRRGVGITEPAGRNVLTAVADKLALEGMCAERAIAGNDEVSTGLLEIGLLARVGNSNGPQRLSFYYSRECDFVISNWARNWPERLNSGTQTAVAELLAVSQSSEARSALRWHLANHSDHTGLMNLTKSFVQLPDNVKEVILGAIGDLVSQETESDDESQSRFPIDLLDVALDAVKDPSKRVRLAAAKLFAFSEDGHEALSSFLSDNYDINLLTNLLQIDEDFPLSRGSAGHIVLKAIQEFSFEDDPTYQSSRLVRDLQILLCSDVRSIQKASAQALGFCAPRLTLEYASKQFLQNRGADPPHTAELFSEAITNAIDVLNEGYWGNMMCKGWLSCDLDDSEGRRTEALQEMRPLCRPLIAAYGRLRHPLANELREFLGAIAPQERRVRKQKPVHGELLKSCGDWSLIQASTMHLPLIGIKIEGFFRPIRLWQSSVKPGVSSAAIIVMLELDELCLQVGCTPEQHSIEVLAPDGANDPLDERMRERDIRNGLDFDHFQDPKVGLPLMESI